jgi:hypothetical protein
MEDMTDKKMEVMTDEIFALLNDRKNCEIKNKVAEILDKHKSSFFALERYWEYTKPNPDNLTMIKAIMNMYDLCKRGGKRRKTKKTKKRRSSKKRRPTRRR